MALIQYRPSGSTAKEIATDLESAVREGHLRPGDLLPSVRALATDLGVAPGTVATAYASLRERGLVRTQGRGGTRISARPPVAARSLTLPLTAGILDLSDGQPDPDLLPAVPARTVISGQPAQAPSELLLPTLLDLGRERLVAAGVPADSLTLAGGGLDAVHRVLAAHLRPEDLIAVEDPGWPNLLDLVAALGLRTFPLLIDADGPVPTSMAAALRAGARAVVVTARAQNPTGASLGRERAAELRAMLAEADHVLVVEDDHAAELSSEPLHTLAGATASWAHVRSVSKPYGPDLRLALISGDAATVARVDGRLQVTSGWISTLLQRVVVDLWTDEKSSAAVSLAGHTYDQRRQALIAALADQGIPAVGASGLNVWVPVTEEAEVVERLRRDGWAVAPGERFRQTSTPGIRITVSRLTPETIPELARAVAATLTQDSPRRYTN